MSKKSWQGVCEKGSLPSSRFNSPSWCLQQLISVAQTTFALQGKTEKYSLCFKIPPAVREKQFSLTVVCLVNVLSFAKEAAYMCVTAEEEELALRWLMIGECLLAPQNRRSSFSGPGWTLRSLSTGPCCVTTHHLCSLAVPPSPNCSAILLPTGLKKQQTLCLRYARTTGRRPPACLSGAAVLRVGLKERQEESEQESFSPLRCWRCPSVCAHWGGLLGPLLKWRAERAPRSSTSAAHSRFMAPKGSAQDLQGWAELHEVSHVSPEMRNRTGFHFKSIFLLFSDKKQIQNNWTRKPKHERAHFWKLTFGLNCMWKVWLTTHEKSFIYLKKILLNTIARSKSQCHLSPEILKPNQGKHEAPQMNESFSEQRRKCV